MLSYEAWMDGRTAVCHNKLVFWRAYKNEWPISWNYEYIIFGQIIFQNFHQFKAFVGLSDCRTIGLSDCRTIGLSDCRTIGLSDYSYGPLQYTTQKTKDWSEQTPITWCRISCSTSDTRFVSIERHEHHLACKSCFCHQCMWNNTNNSNKTWTHEKTNESQDESNIFLPGNRSVHHNTELSPGEVLAHKSKLSRHF